MGDGGGEWEIIAGERRRAAFVPMLSAPPTLTCVPQVSTAFDRDGVMPPGVAVGLLGRASAVLVAVAGRS